MAHPTLLCPLALGVIANLQASVAPEGLTPSWFGSAAQFAGRVDGDERVDLIVFEGAFRDVGRAWVLSVAKP